MQLSGINMKKLKPKKLPAALRLKLKTLKDIRRCPNCKEGRPENCCVNFIDLKKEARKWIKFTKFEIEDEKGGDYGSDMHLNYHQGQIDVLEIFFNINMIKLKSKRGKNGEEKIKKA